MLNLYETAIQLGITSYTLLSWLEEGCPYTVDASGFHVLDRGQVEAWRRNRDLVIAAAEEGRPLSSLVLETIPEPGTWKDPNAKEEVVARPRVTTRQLAAAFGIQPLTVHYWKKAGNLKPLRDGRRWLWDLEEVARWRGVPTPTVDSPAEKKAKRKRRPTIQPPQGKLTTTQLAEALGVKSQTVRDWVKKGCPTAGRLGDKRNSHVFDLEEVRAWVKKRPTAGNWRNHVDEIARLQEETGYLTPQQVADALGASVSRVREWISKGNCPVAVRGHRGRAHLLDLEEVKSWRQARRIPSGRDRNGIRNPPRSGERREERVDHNYLVRASRTKVAA